MSRRPERDILEEFAEQRSRPRYPEVEVEQGLVVEDRSSGFVGDVVRWSQEGVTLRDRKQHLRHFSWKAGGFLLEGRPVTLTRPSVASTLGQRRSAAGAVLSDPGRARVARPHRIWVEGRHDAELLEQVWGDELRELAVVVEPLHGADDLAAAVAEFRPGRGRRLGVLLDHLVPGSKESRIAGSVRDPDVLITGHPFVDVWAGIRPRAIDREAWPEVPLGTPWKEGVCDALGESVEGFWARLRGRVTSFADLEPELVGAVERLIDFVAEPEGDSGDETG